MDALPLADLLQALADPTRRAIFAAVSIASPPVKFAVAFWKDAPVA